MPGSSSWRSCGISVSDRLADDLLGRVAEQALRALVPAHDGAVETLADDGVVRGFDDGREVLRGSLAVFALADVDAAC